MKHLATHRLSGNKRIVMIILFIFFHLLLLKPAQSQAQDSLHLFSVTYIKLKDPTYAKQYESLLNYYSKAVGEYGMRTGKIQGYYVFKVIIPAGSSSDYDYEIAVNSTDITTLLDDTTAILKNAMPGATDDLIKSINEQYSHVRTIVKKEVYNTVDWLDNTTGAKYLEVDYMKPADGKYSDYMKMERQTWKPVHKERMKLGVLSGWEIDEKVMPTGDKESYDVVTANFYDSLPMMLDAKYAQAFKTVWPKMDMNKVGTDVGTMRTMVKSDLLKLILTVDAGTMKNTSTMK